jgi:hypothetical protein
MKWLRWFVAGALAVPLCHQLALAALNASGWISRQPFAMTPTKPLGVPQVISLSFWGGVWGIVLGAILLRFKSPAAFWSIALIFGAIAPTLVAGLVVAPLKGLPAGGDAKLILTGLIVNAAWGLGTAAIYKVMSRRAG